MFLTIASGGNDGLNIRFAELVSDLITVVAFVHHPMFKHMLGRQLLEHGLKQRGIMTGPRRNHDCDPGPLVDTPEVNLGGKAPPERPKAWAAWPPFFLTPRPHAGGLAQWCYR